MTVDTDHRTPLVVAAAAAAAGRAADPATDVADGRAYAWLARLALLHLGDLSALAPLLLQTVTLEPGEALALPPRTLHAYLAGGAIEIMGSSDNVLRGGLTPKHVDVDALLGVVDFHASPIPWVRPRTVSAGVEVYDSGVDAFRLTPRRGRGRAGSCAGGRGRASCWSRRASSTCSAGGGSVVTRPGRAAYVPGDAGALRLRGTGVAWVAEPGSSAHDLKAPAVAQ